MDVSQGLVLATEQHPYCGNISLGFNQLMKYQFCLNEMNTDIMASCDGKCKPACHTIEYEQKVSSASWPSRAVHKAFYDKYVSSGKLKGKFTAVEAMQRQRFENKTACNCYDDFDNKKFKSDLIQGNFLSCLHDYLKTGWALCLTVKV